MRVNTNSQNGTPRNPELQNSYSRYKASEVDQHGKEIQAPDLKLALGVVAGGDPPLLAVTRSGSSNSSKEQPGAPPSPAPSPAPTRPASFPSLSPQASEHLYPPRLRYIPIFPVSLATIQYLHILLSIGALISLVLTAGIALSLITPTIPTTQTATTQTATTPQVEKWWQVGWVNTAIGGWGLLTSVEILKRVFVGFIGWRRRRQQEEEQWERERELERERERERERKWDRELLERKRD